MSEMKFRVVRTAGGFDGTVSIPFLPGAAASLPTLPTGAPPKALSVTAKAATKEKAAKKAASAALKVLDNPIVQSVLPPQAAMALNIAKKVPWKKLRKLF